MFKKEDYNYNPNEQELNDYINNNLWDDFCKFMKCNYNVVPKFEFSKCSLEYGWNVKFKKGSRSLCTVYPRENYFTVLIVIGVKEKNKVEEVLYSFSPYIRKIYKETKESNNQKWLMIDLEDINDSYENVKKLIEIRNSK